MAGIQRSGQLLAYGHVDLTGEGQWLVGDADRIPHPAGTHEKLRFKLWVANPGSRYDQAQGGHVRNTTERGNQHECVRAMVNCLQWCPKGEHGPIPPRGYTILQGNCNLGPLDEGKWILPGSPMIRALGSTLLTPRELPHSQDGYSTFCEQHCVAAGLCESKDALTKRLAWPDHPEAFAWQKTLITVFDGALEILDDTVRTDQGDTHVAQVLKAGWYAFFEACERHTFERDGPRPLLPLRHSLIGNLVASVLFF